MQRRIALIVGAVLAALSRMCFILTANGGTFQSFSIGHLEKYPLMV